MKKSEGPDAQLRIRVVVSSQKKSRPFQAVAFFILGGFMVLLLNSQVSLAEGLNTGFDASYWRKVRAAKGIPSTPEGAEAAQGDIGRRGQAPSERQTRRRDGNGGQRISQSSREVCAQMSQTLADSPCVFIEHCLSPMGRCTSEQAACQTAECIRGLAGGTSTQGAQVEALSLAQEAGRVLGQRTVSARPSAANRTAWNNRDQASKNQRATEHHTWVRNVEHRVINFTVEQLVQEANRIAAEAPAATLNAEQEARRMIMQSPDPNIALTDQRKNEWNALTDKTGRATAHIGWVHDGDHRATNFSVSDLVAAANRLTQVSSGSTVSQTGTATQQYNAPLLVGVVPVRITLTQEANRMIMANGSVSVVATMEKKREWNANPDPLGRANAHLAWAIANGNREPGYTARQLMEEANRISADAVPHDRLTDDQRNQLWHCASEANLSFYHQHSRTVPTDPQIRDHITRCASSRGWRVVEADYSAIMPSVVNELRLLRLTSPEAPHDQLTGEQRDQLWHCASARNVRFYHEHSRTPPTPSQIGEHISACAGSRGWQVSAPDLAVILQNVNNELPLLRLTTSPD